MNTGALRVSALLAAPFLLATGCAPVTTAETSGPGPFSGANANAAAAGINRAGTAAASGQFATGSPGAAVAVVVTNVISKHQASVRQRQVAIQRARAAQAKLVAEQKKAEAAQAAHPGHTAQTAPKTHPHSGANHPAPKTAENRYPGIKRVPRYIAVETVKDEHTAPGAQKAVMIWDTQAQEIVGNNVYDISNPPPVGATSRFETYSAEYVGAGL